MYFPLKMLILEYVQAVGSIYTFEHISTPLKTLKILKYWSFWPDIPANTHKMCNIFDLETSSKTASLSIIVHVYTYLTFFSI